MKKDFISYIKEKKTIYKGKEKNDITTTHIVFFTLI